MAIGKTDTEELLVRKLRRQSCDVDFALTSRDNISRLAIGKFISKAPKTFVKIGIKAIHKYNIRPIRWKRIKYDDVIETSIH